MRDPCIIRSKERSSILTTAQPSAIHHHTVFTPIIFFILKEPQNSRIISTIKYSVALVSAFAAASVAGPIETRQNKKPYVEAPDQAFYAEKCFAGQKYPTSEVCLGTREYCMKKKYRFEGEPFDSVQDCFRSRETPAFREPALNGPGFAQQHDNLCADFTRYIDDIWKPSSEACVGTMEWCNQKTYEKDGEPFDNPKDCIDSRKTAQSGANTQVSKGDDFRQKQAEYCTNNNLGLHESACKFLVAQCAFENQDATSFDVIAECVEYRRG
ncbi:hypothetical protein MY3957_000349 [Beauveria namnaoensis]